jgi:hypothetical protein
MPFVIHFDLKEELFQQIGPPVDISDGVDAHAVGESGLFPRL